MKNLGESLRVKREERGLSLKDVELALSIRIKYLEALEAERYDVIPGEVYVKGFLKNYANYLGLNAEEMVQLYKNAVHPQPIPKSEPVEGKKTAAKKQSRGRAFQIPAAAIAVLIIVGAGYYFYTSYSQSDISKTPNVPPIPSTPNQPPAPLPDTVHPPENVVKQARQGLNVVAKVNTACWIQVFADGKEIFEGLLHAGDVKTWEAKNRIEMTLGNAGGVELTVNDQPQALLGKSGDVVRQVYTAQ